MRKGSTLIELLVVMLVVGSIATLAIPAYMETVERMKAADDVTLINKIGLANRMFALEHNNRYVSGDFGIANCGPGVCPSAPPYNNGCILVWCKYLGDQDFSSNPYCTAACDPTTLDMCNTSPVAGFFTAGSHRRSPNLPYSSWKYTQDINGKMVGYFGAPEPQY